MLQRRRLGHLDQTSGKSLRTNSAGTRAASLATRRNTLVSVDARRVLHVSCRDDSHGDLRSR